MNRHADLNEVAIQMQLNLVGGRDVAAADGDALDVSCPSDGAVFARIARSRAQDVDMSVAAARMAFDGAWGKLTATERGRLLMKLGEAVGARIDELGALEAQDTGKPLSQGRADMAATARYFEFYGSAADKHHGETLPFLNGYTVAVMREPFGVTGHIVPWNYPAQILGRSVGASLACGNACVVKPAEDACLSVLAIARLARDVGFPDGAFNVVAGLGPEAGAALASHPGVNFISFTGSPETGAAVQRAAAANHAGVTLELGGKSPQIVFADADLASCAPVIVRAITQNGGQTCSAGSRLLVERAAYDRVVGAVAELFAKVRVGTHAMDLDLGAMINARQKARVERFADAARADGVPVIAQGQFADGLPEAGHYVRPMLFGPAPHANALVQEEVFGPVLAVIPFADEAEAVRLANGTDFGLVAGIWTRDAARSMRMARAVRAGQVFVNGYGAGGGIELPFGGFGKSGHGREKGFAALDHFSTTKTIVLNHG